jgi:hypothetical protein
MVNNVGQLYTIEGIAAAIIMLVTAYIVLNTTTLYTPADTHVTDMQLEQLGNDALLMMDTADQVNPMLQPVPPAPQYTSYDMKMSSLEMQIKNSLSNDIPGFKGFNTEFNEYVNNLYDPLNSIPMKDQRPIQWRANVYYRGTNGISSYFFADSSALPNGKKMTGNEHFMRVTRFVHLQGKPPNNLVSSPQIIIPSDMRPDIANGDPQNLDQVVLLEVLLWRD